MSVTTCPSCRATIPAPVRTRDGTIECRGCGHEFAPVVVEEVAPPPPAAYERQFAVHPYRSPRGGSPFGLGLAVLNGLVATLIVTVGVAYLRFYVWLIVIGPMLQGLVVGVLPGLAARRANVRYPRAVAAAGAGCGLLSYVGVQYVFYLWFAWNPDAPAVGFWEFMDLRAEAGVRLGRGGDRGLSYAGSIGYWLFEAALTAGVAGAVAANMVGGPFCEGCNRWKRKRELGPYQADPTVALPALAAGSPAGLGTPVVAMTKVALTLYVCPDCAGRGPIDVKAVGTRKVGKTFVTSTEFVTYPGEALAAFEQFDRACRGLN